MKRKITMFRVAHIANDAHPIPGWVADRFTEAGIEYIFQDCFNRQDLERCATDADVLWLTSSRRGLVVEENMDLFPRTGAVIKCGSGTDNIDDAACTRRGIIVAHTPDDPTEPTSDHFIAMLFAAVRRTARQDHLVREGIWSAQAALPLAAFTGATLGLIGFGRIGQRTVKKLSGFEMKTLVFDPYVDQRAISTAGATEADLPHLLRESQFVLVACPLTPETTGLLGEAELRLMRRDAILVNCARAGIVEEAALERALREKWIAAAACDVWSRHPLAPGDALLALDNLTLTPHMGGYSHDYPDAVFASSVRVIIEMSKMRLPRWIVNKSVLGTAGRAMTPRWHMTPIEDGHV
jgi:phosphoglycerate dehydrogenase-like enzyme